MNAIPTKYAGVQFRSRLEARWAAFFDLLGWRWEYEPIDLAGYIPDFIVTGFLGRGRQDILVEVKPITERFEPQRVTPRGSAFTTNDHGLPVSDECAMAIRTIASSGWRGPWQVNGRECSFVFGSDGRRSANVWVDLGRTASPEWREAGNRVQWRAPEVRR